jgi:hypothetical protein
MALDNFYPLCGHVHTPNYQNSNLVINLKVPNLYTNSICHLIARNFELQPTFHHTFHNQNVAALYNHKHKDQIAHEYQALLK